MEPEVKLSCCTAPALISCLLISSGPGQGSGKGELQCVAPVVHTGRSTGRPAGPATQLLAHSLLPGASSGHTLWSTVAPRRILYTHTHTHAHKHQHQHMLTHKHAQTRTDTDRWNLKCIHSPGVLPRKEETALSDTHTHTQKGIHTNTYIPYIKWKG